MGIRWDKGTELWLVPDQWEKRSPTRVVVAEKPDDSSSRHLYVWSDHYEGEVYVPAEHCYSSRDNAIAAAKLLNDLSELKSEDEAEWLTDKIIDGKEAEPYQHGQDPIPPTMRRVAEKWRYSMTPEHRYPYIPSHRIEIYDSEYEALKSNESRPRPWVPVKVLIIPVEEIK